MVLFTNIYHKNQPNVGKYTIHGWYGLDFQFQCYYDIAWCPLPSYDSFDIIVYMFMLVPFLSTAQNFEIAPDIGNVCRWRASWVKNDTQFGLTTKIGIEQMENLEKVKPYSPKWWLNGDLPCYQYRVKKKSR